MNLKYYLRGLGIGIVVSTLLMGIAGGKQTEKPSDEQIKQWASELGMVESTGILADEVPSAKDKEEVLKEDTDTEEIAQVSRPEKNEETENSEEEALQADEDQEAEAASQEEKAEKQEAESEAPIKEETQEEVGAEGEPQAAPEENVQPAAEAETSEGAGQTPEADTAQTQPEAETDPAVNPQEGTEGTPQPVIENGQTVVITVEKGATSNSVCRQLEEAGVIASAQELDLYLFQNGYDSKIIADTYEIPIGADKELITMIITGKMKE